MTDYLHYPALDWTADDNLPVYYDDPVEAFSNPFFQATAKEIAESLAIAGEAFVATGGTVLMPGDVTESLLDRNMIAFPRRCGKSFLRHAMSTSIRRMSVRAVINDMLRDNLRKLEPPGKKHPMLEVLEKVICERKSNFTSGK